MALTIEHEPYGWSVRGERILFDVTSDNSSNDGFRLGVSVTDESNLQTYTFMLTVDVDGHFYYDLSTLAVLRYDESYPTLHSVAEHEETNGNGWRMYTVWLTEYWLIGGVLTPNTADAVYREIIVINATYQMSDGYKPNPNTLFNKPNKYACSTASYGYAISDYKINTHIWHARHSVMSTVLTEACYIPVRNADYGLLYATFNNYVLTNNAADAYKIVLYRSSGPSYSWTSGSMGALYMVGIGCYPANLNENDGYPYPPQSYPDWAYYVVTLVNSAGARCSYPYVFYNADRYGQTDCKYDVVRLAWVGSRGGFNYFNFIKKSERSFTIERKQYKQTRWRTTEPFYVSSDRVLVDRNNAVTQQLTITTDWLQEGEYEYLRGIFTSNQLHIVNSDGTMTPVSIIDTNYVQRQTRDGKLTNLQVKLSYSQDYWV